MKRGDIYYADLRPVVGSEQGGVRPVFSGEYEIEKDSVILLEQLRTIDKKRLKDKVCHLDARVMNRVNSALKVSLSLDT